MVQKRRKNKSDSDDDESFYYRYSSAPATSAAPPSASSSAASARKSSGSGGLAPSKSTVYISNLDYSLTNSDVHTLLSTFGKIGRVTVLKDRRTRQSRGVAFVLFVSREDALNAARSLNGKILNGRTLTASIAADNGRAPEFIRKRVYKDKSKCYECGESGHLSYECPRNQLGPRERPPPPKKRGGRMRDEKDNDDNEGEDEEEESGFEEENWGSVVDNGAVQRLRMMEEREERKKKNKKASYFSDESDEEE